MGLMAYLLRPASQSWFLDGACLAGAHPVSPSIQYLGFEKPCTFEQCSQRRANKPSLASVWGFTAAAGEHVRWRSYQAVSDAADWQASTICCTPWIRARAANFAG